MPTFMKRIYTAWGLEDESLPHILAGGEDPVTFANGETDPDCQKIFWKIEACSLEEAMAINNLRKGFEPYNPGVPAKPCPKSGELFYPEGSGQCWSCDYTC